MTDKNFKLSKSAKRMVTSLGKYNAEFKKLIIIAEDNYTKIKNKKTRRIEDAVV